LTCDFQACDRTAIMGHAEGCDKHPNFAPAKQGINSRSPDEMDDEDEDEKIEEVEVEAKPIPKTRATRARAGPANQ